MQISKKKFQFTESFCYKVDKYNKRNSYLKGLINLIPILSFKRNYKNWKETRKIHKQWHDSKGYHFYDVRHSKVRSTKYFINMIGLGILIVPLRILATQMKKRDKANGWEYRNPHLLQDVEMDMAIHLNENSNATFEEQNARFPGEEDYLKRKIFRNHVKDPCFFRTNVYPDPIFIQGDMEAKERVFQFRQKENEKKEEELKKLPTKEEKIMKRVSELRSVE